MATYVATANIDLVTVLESGVASLASGEGVHLRQLQGSEHRGWREYGGFLQCRYPKMEVFMGKAGNIHGISTINGGFLKPIHWLPSGKRWHYGKSPFLMGKSTISMTMFNSKQLVYQREIDLQQSNMVLEFLIPMDRCFFPPKNFGSLIN